MAGLLPVVSSTKNGVVPSRNYGIVNGSNVWVGNNTNYTICDITSNYFCAMVFVSQYNSACKMYLVSVGKDNTISVKSFIDSSTEMSFTVVDGKLCISGAYDKNVAVVVLKY